MVDACRSTRLPSGLDERRLVELFQNCHSLACDGFVDAVYAEVKPDTTPTIAEFEAVCEHLHHEDSHTGTALGWDVAVGFEVEPGAFILYSKCDTICAVGTGYLHSLVVVSPIAVDDGIFDGLQDCHRNDSKVIVNVFLVAKRTNKVFYFAEIVDIRLYYKFFHHVSLLSLPWQIYTIFLKAGIFFPHKPVSTMGFVGSILSPTIRKQAERKIGLVQTKG